MSDFLIYAARLQDAGITRLLVTIGTAPDRTRTMCVSPMVPITAAGRYPPRTFELCGTDRVLEQVKDDMYFSEGGPTPEKLQAAIDAHPILADDLREWYADILLMPMATEEEIASVELDPAELERSAARVNGMLRGLEIARNRDAMKQSSGESNG